MLKKVNFKETVTDGQINNYIVHDTEISNIKLDKAKKLLSFDLAMLEGWWVHEANLKNGLKATKLAVRFQGIENFSLTCNYMGKGDSGWSQIVPTPLEKIVEGVMEIYREGDVVTINLEDSVEYGNHQMTVIKFVVTNPIMEVEEYE
jgi:hypothetical protein